MLSYGYCHLCVVVDSLSSCLGQGIQIMYCILRQQSQFLNMKCALKTRKGKEAILENIDALKNTIAKSIEELVIRIVLIAVLSTIAGFSRSHI